MNDDMLKLIQRDMGEILEQFRERKDLTISDFYIKMNYSDQMLEIYGINYVDDILAARIRYDKLDVQYKLKYDWALRKFYWGNRYGN